MADIELLADASAFEAEIRAMPNGQLQAQMLVQQGSIHAISFLLAHGCTEEIAQDMLVDLRLNAGALRDEAKRRGMPELFEVDQTAGFH
ncbi:hypothetical protein [Acidovorax sp. A1169]|uniref:hypothetical protein n=1 Tax=Acidovorax sp. A1169 TaxID=3059524 RepID=UPI0027378B47|nr:hypothetical protein [Acidovorax sp. A1169]MDP4076197.1 hypothetical protein [Acidovorax sp. A1169]